MKMCNKCKEKKPLTQFVKNKQCKDGYAGTCKKCQNQYSKNWKQENSERLSAERRKRYAETEGKEVKKRELERRKKYPLRRRCQLLRSGMNDRAKTKGIEFDGDFFTVSYLMERLSKKPHCECCGKKLDIEFKQNKKFNDNSPSMDRVDPCKGYTKENTAVLCWGCNKHKQDATSQELRTIAGFMDVWGNEASEYLGVSINTLKTLANNNKINSFKTSGA
jgi:hypothetical protein